MIILTIQWIENAQSKLLLEKLENPLVRKGSYTLEVKISMKEFLNNGESLEKTIQYYNKTCQLLTEKIPSTHCNLMLQDLVIITEKGKEMENFIKGFFPTRKTRGFLTWIGAMDSDDRTRVDKNVDALRRNEESLKNSVNHQTNTMDAMYKFMDNSMLQIDNRMKQITDNFNALQLIVEGDLNFTNSVKKIVYLESELLETGFRIQTLIENLKFHQNLILQILLGKDQGMTWTVQLLEPATIFKLLEETDARLPGDVTFPRSNTNGDLINEILNIIEVSYETLNNQILKLKLKVPLIARQKFEAFKGMVLPSINNTLITTIGLSKNILIQEENKDWGFVISETEFNNCEKYSVFRICDFKTKETNFESDEDCLLNIRFKNSSKNCIIKILNVTEDTWFATEDPNVWNYIAPYEIKANVFHGHNHSFLHIVGTGSLRLTPGMIIITNHTKLTFANYSILETESLIINFNLNNINFTAENINFQLIPKLKGNMSSYSVYDHKKLFDLGVDIEELKLDRPHLENMVYSPLSSNWTLYSIILATVIITTLLLILSVRFISGKITCVRQEKVESPPSKLRNVKIEHIPATAQSDPRTNKLFNVFANPSLESHGEIMLDSVKCLPPIPPPIPIPQTRKMEENYMVALPNLDPPPILKTHKSIQLATTPPKTFERSAIKRSIKY